MTPSSHPAHMDLIQLREPAILRVLETSERVTGHAGLEMLTASKLVSARGSIKVLDNASGAGVIPSLIRQLQAGGALHADAEFSIVAADKDPMYVGQLEVRKQAHPEKWKDIEVQLFGMQEAPVSDETFDFVFANMGIFFCPDEEKAFKETLRILKPGGQAGFTTWSQISWWPMAVRALSEHFPSAPALPDALTFMTKDWDKPSIIKEKLARAGFTEISVHEHSFAPLIEAERFAEATGQLCENVMKKFWSKEHQEQYAGQAGKAILQHLNENYKDGVWDGKMKALVVLASKEG